MPIATDSPIIWPRRRSSSGSFPVRTVMKMMLSMPRMISRIAQGDKGDPDLGVGQEFHGEEASASTDPDAAPRWNSKTE